MRIGTALLDGSRRACLVEDTDVYVLDELTTEQLILDRLNPRLEKGRWHKLSNVIFDAALHPPVILCTGHNYLDHFGEKTVNRPAETRGLEFFLKAGQTIADPNDALILDPAVTRKLDQETELGVVIGRRAHRVTERDALGHVFGYVVVNDVTARDRQVVRRKDGTFAMELGAAKNFEGSTRLATTMVTSDEVPDPQQLGLTTHINGTLRQNNNTANMIHSVAEIVAFFSQFLVLAPGTVISTGTPAGSGWGQDPELGGTGRVPQGCVPGAYLADGDQVVSEIGTVGSLRFVVKTHCGSVLPGEA